jgi:hypothetical protein
MTPGIDCVVSHHTNAFASGVARFNELLAEYLGVPFLGLRDHALGGFERPLLSFKVSELPGEDAEVLARLLEQRQWLPQLYLHTWDALPLELAMLAAATRVWAGNLEISRDVAGRHPDVREAWAPGLLMDHRVITPAEIAVFSFGMAHKIQTERFMRLRELLAATGRSYQLLVSSATHATSDIAESQAVFEAMAEIFPDRLYFLGNLSDVAVFDALRRSTFFASFFPGGVRANNTSIAAAMEHGAVVITNLDEHSPPHLQHGRNVIDIDQAHELPLDVYDLRVLSANGIEAARAHSWERLAVMMRSVDVEDASIRSAP